MDRITHVAILLSVALMLVVGSAEAGKKKKKKKKGGAKAKAAAVEPVAEDKSAAKAEDKSAAKAEDKAATKAEDEAGPKAEAAPSEKDLEQAKASYLEGKEHYAAGRFDQALAAFTASYNLSAKPDLLFNLGVCSEKLGQNSKAIAYYELYLEENPDAPDKDSVSVRLEALKAKQPAPVPQPEAELEPAPMPPPVVEDELIEEQDEDGRIFWPAAVIGLGGLLLASGGLTAVAAYNKYGDLEVSCSPDCSDGKVSSVKKTALAADIQFAIGGAAVVAGVVWWATWDDGELEAEAGLGRLKGLPLVVENGGGIMLEGGF
jgi:tetratricopeptide (TPR) repeat protein